MMKKRSQGEIFGLALMFVVIIIGIIVYGQIKSVSNLESEDPQVEGEYKILAEGSLNTILEVSTGCYVERNKDAVKDLVNYCLENEYAGVDPGITCDSGNVYACSEVIRILNNTMFTLFNSSEGIGIIPFELYMDVPANNNTLLSNYKFTNFGSFEYKGKIVNESNRRRFAYKRAPSGLISWSTSQRAIDFELYLYYR